MPDHIDTTPLGPHEPAVFRGGFHVVLEDDGTLIIRNHDNKTKRIAILPRADNAVAIRAETK